MSALPEGLADVVARILADHVRTPENLDRLGEWLAVRGLGLVPIASVASFAWPGHWIGVTSSGRAIVMFGSPSGPLEDQLEDGETIVAGYVLALHDLDLERAGDRTEGRVAALVIAAETAGPAVEVTRATAIAGAGLAGDRYASGGGTFASAGRVGQALTLVDADALADAGVSATDARRNVVTSGIDLDTLIGERFRIGDVVCLGHRRAEPCAHLERLTRPGIMKPLVHRAGIRADILVGGEISTGDPVRRFEQAAPPPLDRPGAARTS